MKNIVKNKQFCPWFRAIMLIAVVLGAAFAFAGELPYPELKAVLTEASKVTLEKYPDADYVLLDNLMAAKYNPDGTDESVDDEYILALTEKGRRHLSTVSVWYSASYGSAAIEIAEIVKPDGRVIKIDVAANSRETIDTGQMGSNIYDKNSKYISLSVPGVEIGDIRHLRVRRRQTKSRMPGAWSDYSTFEAQCPILKTTYMVSAPKELPLINRVLRSEITNTVSYSSSLRSDGGVDHVWNVKDVPRYFAEPSMPDAYTVVQRLMVSTLPDWESVSRWYAKLCEKPLADVTEEMREKVKELTANAKDDEAKIRALFAFVSQKIRYMGVTTEEVAPGYEPHPVSVTFDNRYGVCRDKAALLAAMLRLAGFEAYPVLIMVGPKRDPDVPSIFFNHAITAVRQKDGDYQLMDCTNESTKDIFPAYLGNCSFLVANPKGEGLKVSPVYPAEKQMFNVLTEGTLDDTGGALFKSTLSFSGINDTAYRGFLLRSTVQKRRSFFEALVKRRCPGAELVSIEIKPEDLQDTETQLKVQLDFKVPDFPVRGERFDTFDLPWFTDAIGYANFVIGQTGLKERKYPLMTEVACGTEELIVLNVGKAMGGIPEFPPLRELDRGNIEYKFDTGVVSSRQGHVMARRLFKVKAPEFSPAEYQMLKHSLEYIENADKLRLIFEPRPDAALADVEVLDDTTTVELKTPGEWVETVGISKRILTYAGKKKESEFKLSWNPAWGEVELISATVSNETGKVFSAGPDEIHRMDAEWVRSAPRYPAEKLMVVNLPGVEVGSVVSVKYRVSYKGERFFSALNTFSMFSPMRFSRFELIAPASLAVEAVLCNAKDVVCKTNSASGKVSMTWERKAIAPVKQESLLPEWVRFQPSLCLSTGNWKEYAGKIYREFERKCVASEAVSAAARRLVEGISDKKAQALAVAREMIRTIRLSGPRFTELPLSALTEPERTLKDRYGNHADRALLLLAMLRVLDIDARLLIASLDTDGFEAGGALYRQVPQYSYFCKPLIEVDIDGEKLYFNEGSRFDEPGTSRSDLAYVLRSDGSIGQIDVEDGKKRKFRRERIIELDEYGTARITVEEWYRGDSVGSFRQKYEEMLPEHRRRLLLETVGVFGNGAEPIGELFTDTKSYPAVMKYAAEVKNFAVLQGRRMIMKLPSDITEEVFSLRDDRRENPLYVADKTDAEYTVKIRFPKKYKSFAMVPQGVDWVLPLDTGCVKVEVERSVDQQGRLELAVRRMEKRKSGELPPELYPALLEYNRRISHADSKTVAVE